VDFASDTPQDTAGPENSTTSPPSAERLQAYLDQVLLRIWNASPGLASYKESDRIVPETGVVEISFFKLPVEVISGVSDAFGLPEIEHLAYSKQGKACVGFRAKPSAEDLSALAIDDSADHDPVSSANGEDEVEQVEQVDDLIPPAA
jgi:hypothetical protein